MQRVAAALLLAPALALASGAPLDRDLSRYLGIGIRTGRLKDLFIAAPGCNVGVDCGKPTLLSSCGSLLGQGTMIGEPGQAVADELCATGSFFQIFRNNVGACAPGCAAIADPGSAADCSEPWGPPLIGDLNGNGHQSCEAGCVVDRDDVARACGVTLPLPACNPSRPLIVPPNADCPGGDLVPGNFVCDLPPGVYGAVMVRNDARMVIGAGDTVMCSLIAGKATRITSKGPATVLVPGHGAVRLNDFSDDGGLCGGLRIVTEHGRIVLGKNGDYTLDACSIFGKMSIGHGNTLRGHFIGDALRSDRANDGLCCAAPTSTTTTTSTTSTTSSTTTSPTTSTVTTTSAATTTATTTTSPATTVPTTTASTTTATTATATTTTPPSTTTTVTTPTTTTTATPPTTTPTSTSTSSTAPASTTTSTVTSTTSTTVPTGAFTRTPGFWKNHPTLTAQVLSGVGGVNVCGHAIVDVHVDHAHSAVEGLCVAPQGSSRLQLVRQLIAAALNAAAGGAQFADQARCNSVCADPNASTNDVAGCIDGADAFNNSGDSVVAPFDPPGAADSGPCTSAQATACTVLAPATCASP